MTVSRPNERWSMDFVHDYLANGRRYRTLNVVDAFTRECLAIEVDFSLSSARVVRVLDKLIWEYGLPESLRVDNGPEFISKALDLWASQHGVKLDFIEPGKPMQNGHVESFNGRFRDECLSQHHFPRWPVRVRRSRSGAITTTASVLTARSMRGRRRSSAISCAARCRLRRGLPPPSS